MIVNFNIDIEYNTCNIVMFLTFQYTEFNYRNQCDFQMTQFFLMAQTL